VREGGLSFDAAGRKLYALMREVRRRKLSGVMLKGDADVPLTVTPGETSSSA
jgi:hypothetical protein